ncbi:DUF4279 domain-containing protein [Frigoribacterium faeni]|uniref:DUF4279 domain-containing protein n=1 Tax=Frigoribacterium faeni TaxID=145483 RepID=UPI001FAC81CD|nr:DUF4279 domain-containing protein [Frigoribacterium faeni]MCJ0701016.1 DUF4279 domain-containing protein [Frigoribacterium faeni]
MIKNIQVELNIHGQKGSSAHVTQLLGVTPDEHYEIGDPKGDGSRVFDVSIWNLFSNRHVDEIRAKHGQDPWGRVQWVLLLLPQNSADLFAILRHEGYIITLAVSLITDHEENTFTVPAQVVRQVAAAGLDLELTPVSTKHMDISYGDVW